MSLLHRIAGQIATQRKQVAIRDSLARLSDRGLADLGVTRREIRAVARLGARLGPDGASVAEVVVQVRAAQMAKVSNTDRLFAALQRMSARKTEALSYTPSDLDRYTEDARRLRAQTTAAFGRSIGRALADLLEPAKQAVLDSAAGRRNRMELVRRRAYHQIRTELESYSDRELQTDLRLARSGIADIAAEGADERLAAYIAGDPGLRRTMRGHSALRRALG